MAQKILSIIVKKNIMRIFHFENVRSQKSDSESSSFFYWKKSFKKSTRQQSIFSCFPPFTLFKSDFIVSD